MKCFWNDALPSSYFYYLCASFCFIFYSLDTMKEIQKSSKWAAIYKLTFIEKYHLFPLLKEILTNKIMDTSIEFIFEQLALNCLILKQDYFSVYFSWEITSIIRYMFSTSLMFYPFDIHLCLFIDSESRAELEKNFNKL